MTPTLFNTKDIQRHCIFSVKTVMELNYHTFSERVQEMLPLSKFFC